MFTLPTLISVQDMAVLLGISKETVIKLAATKQIPSVQDGNNFYFYFSEVKRRFSELQAGRFMMTLQSALYKVQEQQQHRCSMIYLRSVLEKEHPDMMQALRLVDEECKLSQAPKYYYLLKVPSKRLGFVYYVRYQHNGKMIPSKWCTYTNDHPKACEFAISNRERLVSAYLERDSNEVIRFFAKFYDGESDIFKDECRRNKVPEEKRRRKGFSLLTKKFIPFLIKNKVKTFDKIDVPLLDHFQDALLADELKPQSINLMMAAVGKALKYLARKGTININPYKNLPRLPVKNGDRKTHGCYEITKLKGVFDKPWDDYVSFLLNLLIYTTSMRNIEIKSFCKDDMLNIAGCWFIDLKRSKTENGLRLVPLHERVYQHIMQYAQNLDGSSPIFGTVCSNRFCAAAQHLGTMMNVSDEFCQQQNITFYSGRHAWKTMMNAGNLGEDIEEVFMGHKVSGNVAKLYNHRDKQGQELMLQKARDVFAILDEKLFACGERFDHEAKPLAGFGEEFMKGEQAN